MRFLGIVLGLLIAAPAAAAPSGKDIIDKVADQAAPTNAVVEIEMNLTGNHSGTRRLISYVRRKDERTSTVIKFQEPADYRGAGILAVEGKDGDVDRYIRLNGQNRVRRLPSGSQSGSFLNTDFSYEDFDGRRDEEGTKHNLLREEKVDGVDTWVVESIPGKKSGSSYKKVVQWIRKDNYTPVRIDFFKDDDKPLKRLTVLELKQIDGYWISTKSRMSTLEKGTNTELSVVKTDFKSEIPDRTFERRFLME